MKPNNITAAMLSNTHTITWQAQVFAPDGTEVAAEVESGSVTLDGLDRSRTRGDIALVDPGGLWDRLGVTGASPFGGSVLVSAYTCRTEVIPIAAGLILEVMRERPGAIINVAFVDYGAALEWNGLGSPRRVAAGQTIESWVRWATQFAGATDYIFDPGVPATVPTEFIEETNNEGIIAKLCTDANIVVWFDEQRRVRVQPAEILASKPAVWTLSDGPGGNVTQERHSLSRDGVPSIVVVTGETPRGAERPYTGFAYQTTGPTAYTGPYGRVVLRANRPVLNSNAAANAAAATILRRQRMLKRQLSVSTVAHPALEPGDRIDIEMSGAEYPMVLESVRFDMSPDPAEMTLVEPEP